MLKNFRFLQRLSDDTNKHESITLLISYVHIYITVGMDDNDTPKQEESGRNDKKKSTP